MAVNSAGWSGREVSQPEINGLLNIDKPSGWTSHDVVAKLRGALRVRKIGHTGTLDPMATGVLLICVGQATRISRFLLRLEKEYEGTMRLGAESDTLDADGHITLRPDPPVVRLEEVQEIFHRLTGHIEQTPPMHSAVKHHGQPLYRLARKGQTVPRRARPIVIRSLEICRFQLPQLMFRVVCSSGTYVRALAAEVGHQLGCGAYLEDLRRLRIGQFSAQGALPLDQAVSLARGGKISEHLLPLARGLAEYPRLVVHNWAAAAILQGRSLSEMMVHRCDPSVHPGDTVRVEDTTGKLLAMARLLIGSEEFSPKATRRSVCQFLLVLSSERS